MRRIMLACAVMVALGFCAVSVAKAKATVDSHPATDTHEEWKLGVQAYSFRKYTFFEAVDKAAALGLDWIEAYPGQKVGGPFPKVRLRPNVDKKVRQAVKKKLDDAGVQLVNYGVVGLPNNEKKCRQVFEFAEDMGVKTIVSEPPAEALKIIDKLCREYKINVAIHNHPKPSPYWNPDKILEATRGLSKRIGACADPGHWERSGLDPVQSLQKLEGRIVSLHLKDVENGHGILWNTGNRDDINRVLAELRRQDFEGVISIEYERNRETPEPDIRKCIYHYEKVVEDIFGKADWQNMLRGDLSRWYNHPDGWTLEAGELKPRGKGDIWTKGVFEDFVLDLEFKVQKDSNSGVFLRCTSMQNWLHNSMEVQVLDSFGKENVGRHDCGAIYDCLAPAENAARKPGEWNHYTIACDDNKVSIVLNGVQIIDMNLNKWKKPHRNPDGSKNKFNRALKTMVEAGRIGLQDHGKPFVHYRNVRVNRLD